ncbi:hypothetical protein MtrunA17_Chr1g0187111 [Medicago truncatula]|uniref:Uncharacterized protein n=1 Tax=Medicago truncatula TaxID=3880 RepID=A0A396JS37_MEDTR|nr:hypothetical protein MtrunA17_Chr1g0187111 [Medicago truncatula]
MGFMGYFMRMKMFYEVFLYERMIMMLKLLLLDVIYGLLHDDDDDAKIVVKWLKEMKD